MTTTPRVSVFGIFILICILGFLDRNHSDWREMVSHSGFDLHFSDNE